MNDDEVSHGTSKCMAELASSAVTIETKPEPKVFSYDFVVDEDATQESVFLNVAKPIADY